jgi:hypothetical protein
MYTGAEVEFAHEQSGGGGSSGDPYKSPKFQTLIEYIGRYHPAIVILSEAWYGRAASGENTELGEKYIAYLEDACSYGKILSGYDLTSDNLGPNDTIMLYDTTLLTASSPDTWPTTAYGAVSAHFTEIASGRQFNVLGAHFGTSTGPTSAAYTWLSARAAAGEAAFMIGDLNRKQSNVRAFGTPAFFNQTLESGSGTYIDYDPERASVNNNSVVVRIPELGSRHEHFLEICSGADADGNHIHVENVDSLGVWITTPDLKASGQLDHLVANLRGEKAVIRNETVMIGASDHPLQIIALDLNYLST